MFAPAYAPSDSQFRSILSEEIKFNPNIMVDLIEEDGKVMRVKLNEAMVWMQGEMVNLLLKNQGFDAFVNVIINYYTSIYPAF